jgi:hypothetical protein
MDKWINVKYKKPEHYGDLLILLNNKRMRTGYYNQHYDKWYFSDDDIGFDEENEITKHKVTHWQPLPELPED